jgi:predicted metal-dependent HD superfamily phosphohydrolase
MVSWDLSSIRDYVLNCFEQDKPGYLHYHNLSHTRSVVIHVDEIALFYGVQNEDLFILLAAAWFHDLGHLYDSPANHEYKSAILMKDFLKNSYPDEVLKKIRDTILATRELSTPKTQLEKIIRDADTYHFGTDEFLLTDKLVKQEVEERTKQKYHHWTEHTLRLLQKHKFYTSYCKARLNSGKERNISILETQIRNSSQES